MVKINHSSFGFIPTFKYGCQSRNFALFSYLMNEMKKMLNFIHIVNMLYTESFQKDAPFVPL